MRRLEAGEGLGRSDAIPDGGRCPGSWGLDDPPSADGSALGPGAFRQDQPDADRTGHQVGDPISDQVGTSLLVRETALEPLRPDLSEKVQTANVEFTLASKPNLEVADRRRADPWLLRAVDGLGNDVRERFAEPPQGSDSNRAVVDHVDERHGGQSCVPCPRVAGVRGHRSV